MRCGQDWWVILQLVVDTCTGEWLGYVFDKKSRAQEALQLLTQVVLDRFPKTGHAGVVKFRVDNGPAYRSDRFYDGARALGLEVEYIQIHTPEDNGMIESFHASLDRDYLPSSSSRTRTRAPNTSRGQKRVARIHS